jgi:nucleoside-diphosphate-sugar epimerase
VRIVAGNITDLAHLENIVDEHGVERVVHTATIHGKGAQVNPPRTAMVNVVGSANILEVARRRRLTRVVLSGSSTVAMSILGEFKGETVSEDVAPRVMTQHPISFYAATKLAVEYFVHLYAETYGVDGVVVRYGRVLGAWPGSNLGSVASMLQAHLGPAAQGRPVVIDDPAWLWEGSHEFVDARDCAAGTIGALFAEHLSQRVYHVNCDRLYRYEEFLDALRRVYPNLTMDIRVKAVQRGLPAPPDISAAGRDFGYRPRHDLESSLRYLSQFVLY